MTTTGVGCYAVCRDTAFRATWRIEGSLGVGAVDLSGKGGQKL